jgi:hypothetical protein
MTSANTFRSSVIIVLTLSMLSACSSSPKKMNLLRAGDTISIVSDDPKGLVDLVKITNSSTEEGTGKGSKIGAASGALYGLACGPAFIICSPVLASVGFLGGAVAGAVVGGVTGDLDDDKVTMFSTKLNNYLERNEPQEKFLETVITVVGRKYDVQASPAQKEISIVVGQPRFEWRTNGNLIFVIKAKLTANVISKSGREKTIERVYDYTGAPQLVDMWIEEGEEFYQSKFNEAYRSLAYEIVNTL